jgi:hypothetical protein
MSYELIQKYTVPSATSLVTLNTLPTGYKDLRIMTSMRSSGAVPRENVSIRINNDTTATNYVRYEWYFEDGSAGGETIQTGNATRLISSISGTGATSAYSFGTSEISIPDYNNTSNYKQVFSTINSYNTTANWDNWGLSVVWKNTAAITTLSFEGGSYNIAAGSIISIYGLK